MPRAPSGKRTTAAHGTVTVRGKRANGAGSIYFDRANGCWWATYRLPGERRNRKLRAKTQRQAEERRANAIANSASRPPDASDDGAVGHGPTVRASATERTHVEPSSTATSHRTTAPVRPLLVTVTQAAEILAVGRTTIYQLISDGALTPVRIGRNMRLTVAELERFVSDRIAQQG